MLRVTNNIFLSFQLNAGSAAVAPPLSTVLGNEGVKTKLFCDEFNSLTRGLPRYLILRVYVIIDKATRTYRLSLGSIPMGKLMRLISSNITTYYLGSGGQHGKIEKGITLTQLGQLCLFFFQRFSLKYLKIFLGIVKSLNLLVIE